MYGLREGLTVSILRSLLGTLISGSMSSLIYSLSGAVASTLVMAFFYRFFSNTFSLAGISIIGGVTHNFTQITVASLILSTPALYVYLPYLMIVGLLTLSFLIPVLGAVFNSIFNTMESDLYLLMRELVLNGR